MSFVGSVLGTASILIRPDSSLFGSELTKNVQASLDSTEAATAGLSGLESAGKLATEALVVGFTLASTAAVHLADNLDLAKAKLDTAITNTGVAPQVFAGQIAQADQSLERLGFTSAQTDSALAILTTGTHNAAEATKDLSTVVDVAVARNLTLDSAAQAVTRGLGGYYTALTRAGIVTKEQAANIHSQADLLAILNEKYGGQGAAAADTYAGKLKALTATAKDLGAAFGNALIPQIERVATVGVDVAQFFERNRVAADALALVVGGSLAAAMGAYVIREAQLAAGTLARAFSAGLEAASRLGDYIAGVQTPAVVAEASAEEQVAVAKAADLEATAGLTVAVSDLGISVEALNTYLEILLEELGVTFVSAESAAATSADVATVAIKAEGAAALATAGDLGVLNAQSAATGVGGLTQLGEGAGLSAGALGEIGVGSGVAAGGLTALAGPLAVIGGLVAGGIVLNVQAGHEISNLGDAAKRSVAGLGSAADQLKVLNDQLKQAESHPDLLTQILDFGGKPSGVAGADSGITSLLSKVDQAVGGTSAKVKALKQQIADLQAQGTGLTAADVLGDSISALVTYQDATAAVTASQAAYDAANQKVVDSEQKIADSEQSLVNAHQKAEDAALALRAATATLAAEETHLYEVQHDTGQYALDLSDATNAVAKANLSAQDAAQKLADAEQRVSDVAHDTGQYAIDLANAENAAERAATSLADANLKLSQEQLLVNQVLSDSGVYLEDQQKASIGLQQALYGQIDATASLTAAELALSNLQDVTQAKIDTLAEAHNNVALAQELANIQAGDATQNSLALALASENVGKAQLGVQTAALAVADAQTKLNDVNNEAIPGTEQYTALMDALANAQQADENAVIGVADSQAKLNTIVNEGIPGTKEYAADQRAVASAQIDVSSNTNAVSAAQIKLNGLINEAIPGTKEYDAGQLTLAQDLNAVSRAHDAIAQANVDAAKAIVATQDEEIKLQKEITAADSAQRALNADLAAANQLAVTLTLQQNEVIKGYATIGQQNAQAVQAGIIHDTGGFNALTGGAPLHRAGGGPVQVGGAYLVGEQGEELFVPDQGGTIVPNQFLTEGGQGLELTLANTDVLRQVGGGMQSAADSFRVAAEALALAQSEAKTSSFGGSSGGSGSAPVINYTVNVSVGQGADGVAIADQIREALADHTKVLADLMQGQR